MTVAAAAVMRASHRAARVTAAPAAALSSLSREVRNSMFCNYEQYNWSEMLPMGEYAYNNSVTTATGLSPFYANYSFHP